DFGIAGLEGFGIEYGYGDFDGDNQHLAPGEKDHEVTEHDIIMAYAPSETWDAELIYCNFKDENRNIDGGNDAGFERVVVRANYNF
ncbi:MAG: hypothetical protein U9Q62_05435, partial [Campylobacterota bacterium]|nr:hypothetical protein [Campylobacterota bacterium]